MRSDITILPGDDPDKPRLGWLIEEKASTTNNIYDYSGKEKETEEADRYRTSHAETYKPPSGGFCWTDVDVLHPIWGKPWNNLALAYVHTLRPSAIRVVSNDGITLDGYIWRVTVYLEEDDRTIRKIDQEVEVSGLGIKTGEDFSRKLAGVPLPEPSDEPIIYCNLDAIKKLDIES